MAQPTILPYPLASFTQIPHLLSPLPLVPPFGVVPTSLGQVPVVHQPWGLEYSMLNNSHPYQGEEIFNPIPQGENQNVDIHNSSGWSSGFTTRL